MTEQRTIHVDGMTCGGCEQSVQTALGRLGGVEHVTADHTDGTVEVRFDATQIGLDTIRDGIRNAGYTIAQA